MVQVIGLIGSERKVVLFIACSLDGYIAGIDGEIGWLFSDQDYGHMDFLNRIDTVIMGRTTYDQLLGMGNYPYQGKDGYVFSRLAMGGDEHVEFVKGPVNEFINVLRANEGRDIGLVGGSEILYHFMMAEIVDEFIISMHPIVLGQGIPLFMAGISTNKLRLEGVRSFSSGLVQMIYKRV